MSYNGQNFSFSKINVIDNHPNSDLIYRNLFLYVNDAILLMESDRFIDCNPKALELFECSREELLGKSPVEFSPTFQPDGRRSETKARENIEQVMKGESLIFEWDHKTLAGKVFHTEVSLNSIKLPDEIMMIALVRDVTLRKKAKQSLSESEARYKSLVEKSPDGIVIQHEGKVLYVNPMAGELAGVEDRNELIGRNIYDFVHPDFKELVKQRINISHHEKREIDKIELKLVNTKNELLYIEASVAPITYKGKSSTIHFLRNITERKIAHDELKENQRMLTTLMGNLPGVVYRCLNDKYFTMKFVSEGITKLTGYTPFEIIENKFMSFSEIIVPEDKGKMAEQINKAIEKREPFEIVYDIIAKDNSRKTVWERGLGIFENNQMIALEGFITDITDKKQAEEALKENEERFRLLFENSTVGIYRSTIDGKILMANPAVIKMLGYDNFEDLAKINTKKGYVNEKHRDEFLETLRRDEEVYGFESSWKKKNGDIVYIRESARAVKNSNGDIVYIEGGVEDITDRWKAEEKLLETNILLEKTFASLGEAVFILKYPERKILACNPAVNNIFGYTRNELIGKTTEPLHINEEYYKKFIQLVEKHLEKNNSYQFEFKMKKKNGNIIITENTVTTLFEDKGWQEGFVSVVRDITQRKAAEVNLIKAKKIAEQSNRLKSEFLAQMSHEIRTPINAILSFAGLIREELEDQVNEDLKTSFNIMNRAGKRIIRTIDLILNMAEIQTGTYEYLPRKFDLFEEILESLYLSFIPQAKDKNIELLIDKQIDECLITADEYTMTQIFSNLIDNAIKFTSDGYVKISIVKNNDDELTVEVEDTGIGITNEYLPEIFLPFTQEEQGYTRKFEGSGLGLALVKKYCDLNNTTLLVDSEKQKGTKFTIIFPKNTKVE